MRSKIAEWLIKTGLKIAPLTPEVHKQLEPLLNRWVDTLNKVYWEDKE